MLVGTKLDDVENRVVSREKALEICQQYDCIDYFETSASTGENVDEAFFSATARAFQTSTDSQQVRSRQMSLTDDRQSMVMPEEDVQRSKSVADFQT